MIAVPPGMIELDTVAKAWGVTQTELKDVLAALGYNVAYDSLLNRQAFLTLVEQFEIKASLEAAGRRLRDAGQQDPNSAVARLEFSIRAKLSD